MTSRRRSTGHGWPRDERGEALPAAILFLGVMFTILIGVHVVITAIARTAVQAAADAALAAAQAAGPGPDTRDCDGDPDTLETVRQCEGIVAAQIAMAGAQASVMEIRTPVIAVDVERGSVTAFVFGGTISPVLGSLDLTGKACGPLDDMLASDLVGTDPWRC